MSVTKTDRDKKLCSLMRMRSQRGRAIEELENRTNAFQRKGKENDATVTVSHCNKR